MFFPCTTQEIVMIDGKPAGKPFTINKENRGSVNSSSNEGDEEMAQRSCSKVPEYLSKPTVVMCNPNALVYQQMITSPNAYWLHFFLRREINVVCWNYRGYGESE